MVNRPAANHSAATESSDALKQKKANETQQAVVLFIIVLVRVRESDSSAAGRETNGFRSSYTYYCPRSDRKQTPQD